MKTKLLVIIASLISSASAFATHPEPVLDCRRGFTDVALEKYEYNGEYILFTGKDEIYLRREKFNDGTCPAPEIRYVGTAKDGAQYIFHGDLDEVRPSAGEEVKLSFSVEKQGKRARSVSYKCFKYENDL